MVHSIQTLSVTLTTASVLAHAWMLSAKQVSAHTFFRSRSQIASATYSYNPQMMRLYTYECTKKLQEIKGESPDQAKQICQCSITQMQQQYSQSQAIQIVNKAQASVKNDPTVIPSELSPFFTPCFSTEE